MCEAIGEIKMKAVAQDISNKDNYPNFNKSDSDVDVDMTNVESPKITRGLKKLCL